MNECVSQGTLSKLFDITSKNITNVIKNKKGYQFLLMPPKKVLFCSMQCWGKITLAPKSPKTYGHEKVCNTKKMYTLLVFILLPILGHHYYLNRMYKIDYNFAYIEKIKHFILSNNFLFK